MPIALCVFMISQPLISQFVSCYLIEINLFTKYLRPHMFSQWIFLYPVTSHHILTGIISDLMCSVCSMIIYMELSPLHQTCFEYIYLYLRRDKIWVLFKSLLRERQFGIDSNLFFPQRRGWRSSRNWNKKHILIQENSDVEKLISCTSSHQKYLFPLFSLSISQWTLGIWIIMRCYVGHMIWISQSGAYNLL